MKKLIILALFVATVIPACTRIDAANEGILVKQYGDDKGQGVSLVSGRVWYNPFTADVYEYPVFVQTKDYDPFSVNAKDGSIFTIDPTLSFRIIRGKSPDIFRKYRQGIKEITDGVIRNYTKDAFKNVFNLYTTNDILSRRQEFDNKVTILLKSGLEKEGFEVEQMTFGMRYPESITQAIDLKNKAVQEADQARNQLVRDSIEAKRKIIIATAEKEANELRSASLTPMLIQQQFIERWNGSTPLYGNAPMIFKNIQ